MALISCWAATALWIVGQSAGASATKIAVVNVPVVSERYLKTSDLEAQFEQKRRLFSEQRNALRQQIEQTQRSLQEEFKPGTKEYGDRAKKMVMLEAELQWLMESESRRIEQELANSLCGIYDDIQEAVRKVAGEREIDLVLAADQLPDESPVSTTQARQQIMLQKVLYWHPRVDLTEDVVAKLNETYKTQQPTTSARLAPSPLSDKRGSPR